MIKFHHHAGIHTLIAEQLLPVNLAQGWDFFSNPANLAQITPPYMNFVITSPNLNERMYPGQIITYRVSPLPGFRINWVTEITQVKPLSFFIDEQRFGPYALWHHEHRFLKNDNGTLMQDQVTYKLPLGSFGKIVNTLLVQQQLLKIFQYREKVTLEIFGL